MDNWKATPRDNGLLNISNGAPIQDGWPMDSITTEIAACLSGVKENARTHIPVFCEYLVGLEYLVISYTVDFWVYLPSTTTFGPKIWTQDEIKIILKSHMFMQFQSAYQHTE